MAVIAGLCLLTTHVVSVAQQEASSEPKPEPEYVEAALGLDPSAIRLIQLGLGSEGFDPGPPFVAFERDVRTWNGGTSAFAARDTVYLLNQRVGRPV